MSKYTYSDETLRMLVKANVTYAGVLRGLGIKVGGGSHKHIRSRISKLGLDTSHFRQITGTTVAGTRKKHWSQVLVDRVGSDCRQSGKLLTRALKEFGRKYFCEHCGLQDVWNNKPIVLSVDHIDGNWTDDRPENLRFLCPNCHTQTPTFGNRKIKRCAACDDNTSRKSKWCRACSAKHMRRARKVENRPPLDVLLSKVQSFGYVATGREFGVTDNTIRKWVKAG